MSFRIKFKGFGSCLPKKIVKNEDLPKELDTNHEWIFSKTGIKQRHLVSGDETTVSLAVSAAFAALKDAGILESEIGAIVLATTTPNNIFPSSACLVQANLGCKKAFAFDLQAVCSGFLYGFSVARSLIVANNSIKNVLLIGADTISRLLDWQDRSTAVLFGDGAGAVVIGSEDGRGFFDQILLTDGNFADLLYVDGGVSLQYKDKGFPGFLKMNGKSVFKNVINFLSNTIIEILKRNFLTVDDIDYFIFHQANLRIIDSICQILDIEKSKVLNTIDKHANTSAASIPLVLNDYKDIFNRGNKILMAAAGAGLCWGSIIFEV